MKLNKEQRKAYYRLLEIFAEHQGWVPDEKAIKELKRLVAAGSKKL